VGITLLRLQGKVYFIDGMLQTFLGPFMQSLWKISRHLKFKSCSISENSYGDIRKYFVKINS